MVICLVTDSSCQRKGKETDPQTKHRLPLHQPRLDGDSFHYLSPRKLILLLPVPFRSSRTPSPYRTFRLTGATISWTTNGNSTSEVLYDTSSHTAFTEYAFTSAFDSTMVSDHSVTLSDLSVQQTYYFRVKSVVDKLTVISSENSFTTLSGGGAGSVGGGSDSVRGFDGRESGGASPGPGVTNLVAYIDGSGSFNIAATASSEDGKVKLNIARGVQGLGFERWCG